MFRTGCTDYSSVRRKSYCTKKMERMSTLRTGYANYSSVRRKLHCAKEIDEFDRVPITPAS